VIKKTVFAVSTVLLLLGVLFAGPLPGKANKAKRVIILGIDGMDPDVLKEFIDQGVLPNFKKLAEQGDFKPLQTSMPPLSPVAWATFITGMDPGGHGIYDFVSRDPATYIPFEAMAETYSPEKYVNFGSWVLPLSSGGVRSNRKGTAFWQVLDKYNVPSILYRMPVNFPPAESKAYTISGMGAPDIQGTAGSFSYYTDNPPANADKISGGEVYSVEVDDNRVDAQLIGPKNTFRREPRKSATGKIRKDKKTGKIKYTNPACTIDFSVFLDPDEAAAKIVVQDDEFILKEGEWSDWIRVDFEVVPHLVSISAIARFYLQQVRPDFRLYVSPLQINPEDPALQISTPEDWAHELFEDVGYFYTQTFPQENKAFSGGLFSPKEYWTQAQYVLEERKRMLDHLLESYEEGLLFFYFSSVDLNGHMLWKFFDSDHPAYDPEAHLQEAYAYIYKQMDDVLGEVMDNHVDENTTLIVMSDHGFSRFYWGFNLNTWLVEKGYLKLRNPSRQGEYGDLELFTNVDWRRTKAYGSGLIGLYLNLRGREKNGVVAEADYDRILDQLEADLYAIRDPRNGEQVVTLVTRPRRDFHGDYKDAGPDIIVGYNRGYRIAWESTLGGIPKELFIKNDAAWSGDHQVDYRIVPGVLLTNQKITLDSPALHDLTVAVMDEFGVPPLKEMIGKDCLGPRIPKQLTAEQKETLEKLGAEGYLK